jgi:hypothetical protein
MFKGVSLSEKNVIGFYFQLKVRIEHDIHEISPNRGLFCSVLEIWRTSGTCKVYLALGQGLAQFALTICCHEYRPRNQNTYNSTNSMEPALFEKPPVVQLFKNFPAFYRTRRFITVFTRALHWSLS